ncbi:MAG: hypothetical protein B6242_08870 [Anaerolineaceae bacterium 4572_78]|nr:MAG: hypothetical protein B6242_08870 [Anaerolineaceae bacterium 4572_78]
MTTQTLQTSNQSQISKFLWLDFIFIITGGLALAGLIFLAETLSFLASLRFFIGVIYVLFIPGYALTLALFPSRHDLDSNIERFGLSIGLSIALVSIIAPLINLVEINSLTIVLGIYGFTFLFMVVAFVRRYVLPMNEVYHPNFFSNPLANVSRVELYVYASFAVMFVIMTAIFLWIYITPSADDITEFYILGKTNKVEYYPQENKVGTDLVATIGIVNRQSSQQTYQVQVWAVDPWQENKQELVQQIEHITLLPNQQIEQVITWQMPYIGSDQQVHFLLFTSDNSQPYRQLQLWLDVIE